MMKPSTIRAMETGDQAGLINALFIVVTLQSRTSQIWARRNRVQATDSMFFDLEKPYDTPHTPAPPRALDKEAAHDERHSAGGAPPPRAHRQPPAQARDADAAALARRRRPDGDGAGGEFRSRLSPAALAVPGADRAFGRGQCRTLSALRTGPPALEPARLAPARLRHAATGRAALSHRR